MATQKIFIINTTEGCVIVPAYAIVDPGDKVQFVNITGGTATVSFPHTNVFGNPSDAFIAILEPSGGKSKFTTPKAAVDQGTPKNFPYTVFCTVSADFAYGGSNPEIIVP